MRKLEHRKSCFVWMRKKKWLLEMESTPCEEAVKTAEEQQRILNIVKT